MSKGHFILYNSNEKNFTSMGVLVLDNYIMNTIIKETMNENYTFEFESYYKFKEFKIGDKLRVCDKAYDFSSDVKI